MMTCVITPVTSSSLSSFKKQETAEASRCRPCCTCVPHACSVCCGLCQHLAGLQHLCKTTWHTCTIQAEGRICHAHNGLLTALCDECCLLQQREMHSTVHPISCHKTSVALFIATSHSRRYTLAALGKLCSALPSPALTLTQGSG